MAVQLLEPKKQKWAVITMGDGYSRVHSFGDYILGEDHFFYLYKQSRKDVEPIAIFKMGAIMSIVFSDEEPQLYPEIPEEQLKDENEV